MKTTAEIALDAINSIQAAKNSSLRTISLMATVAQAAVEADRAQRGTVAATAQHWSVRHESDEAGDWTYLEVYAPEEDEVPIVNVSLSDVEADDLARHLQDRTY